MQVNQEINLLQWLSFADWVTLEKVEILIDWVKNTVSDPNHFTPEYPWTCSIIFSVKKNNNTYEVPVDWLNIKALEYNAPSFETANIINNYYSWFNVLPQQKQNFIYNHILTSYITEKIFRQNNLEYIIMGEVPVEVECENVGQNILSPHADWWYNHINNISPFSKIKACWWGRSDLEKYVNQNPNKLFFVSCAYDILWWDSLEQLKWSPDYTSLKNILNNENIIISVASWNLSNMNGKVSKILNENAPYESEWVYRSASVNSNKNNKICVTWYNPWQENVFWWEWNNVSSRPVWFWKWNIVIPFINMEDTSSSFSTAAESGSLWNFLSIIMYNHTWSTLEDAMTIMINNYLTEDTFKYKDDDWNIQNWWKRYFFNTDKFIQQEILQTSKINAINLNSDDVELPSDGWLCYVWKWIQYEYNWERYNITNKSKLVELISSWKNVKWYRNKKTFLKYGWKNSASFDVYVMDNSWKLVPDVQLKNVTKSVQ